MAVFAIRRWAPLAGRSARLRLTLLYSGMFLALGTVIVVAIFAVGSGGGSVSVSASSQAASPQPSGPAAHVVAAQQHSADVNRLLAGAWVTLVLTAAASAVLGWFVARRVLRPLRQMTSATQTISAGSLHQRLALEGPRDEFKELGDTIDELLSRLEGSFVAQRRFVANAAHELRTPLTVDRTLLQVALSDPNATEGSLRAACEELLASGRDHERLLDSLLTLAISERGLEHRELVDLTSVVRSVLESPPAEIEQQSLALNLDLQPAEISGDPALLERLATNLIDNAARYNEPGGHIGIRTAVDAGHALLAVTNTGAAVPSDDIDRLFEPFRRLRTDRTAANGHHGLGLSIVRAVATAHDATVTAEPGPFGGLAITVTFRASPG